MFGSEESEAMNLFARFGILGEFSDCFPDDSLGCVP